MKTINEQNLPLNDPKNPRHQELKTRLRQQHFPLTKESIEMIMSYNCFVKSEIADILRTGIPEMLRTLNNEEIIRSYIDNCPIKQDDTARYYNLEDNTEQNEDVKSETEAETLAEIERLDRDAYNNYDDFYYIGEVDRKNV